MLLLNRNHKDEIISIVSFLGGDRVKSIDNKRSHSWHTDYIPTSLHQCTHYLLAKVRYYLFDRVRKASQAVFSRRK